MWGWSLEGGTVGKYSVDRVTAAGLRQAQHKSPDFFKLFFNDPFNQPQLSTGPSLSSLPWMLYPLSHLSHAVHKGFLTDKLLGD